jgi:hypothetical protein
MGTKKKRQLAGPTKKADDSGLKYEHEKTLKRSFQCHQKNI